MNTPKVCRICLGTNIKLYKYDDFDLKYYYEQIMGSNINVRDGLPIHFCYECAALLHKFHKFKEKCHIGQKALKELKLIEPISLQSIRRIDRPSINLESSLNLLSVNHRVRSFIVKSKAKTQLERKGRQIEIDLEEISSVSYDYDDDFLDNFDDTELPPVPELVALPEKPEIENVNVERGCSVIVFNEHIINEEKNFMFDEKINVPDEKILVEEEKINVDEEQIPEIENVDEKKIPEIEKVFTDDERLIENEDEIFVSVPDIKISEDEQEVCEVEEPKKNVAKKKKKTKGTKRKNKVKDGDYNDEDYVEDEEIDRKKKKSRKKVKDKDYDDEDYVEDQEVDGNKKKSKKKVKDKLDYNDEDYDEGQEVDVKKKKSRKKVKDKLDCNDEDYLEDQEVDGKKKKSRKKVKDKLDYNDEDYVEDQKADLKKKKSKKKLSQNAQEVDRKKKHSRKKISQNAQDDDEKKKNSTRKFSQNAPKTSGLDPNNWVKYMLNEDEALAEFKSKALHRRFAAAEYKCHDCLKGFSKEDMLNRHVKLRHSDSLGPIECRFCRMRFKWKCFLRKHMRQHYTKYKCLRCDLVCPLETTALFHEEYHNGVIRKCAHCGEEFKHLTTYYTHLRSHRSEHVCKLCGASFVSTIGLKIHKKIKHLNKEPEITEDAQGKEYCKRCDIKFETVKAYEEHLIHSAMHSDGIEDSESQAPTGANPKKRQHNPKKLPRIPTDCHLCGKHFATQAACRKHHLAEHPRTSFFAPNERQICEICGISLAPGSVSSHLNTHTREKMYSCSICGRQFSSKGGMNTHQLTHTSEKPVACTLCDKRFKQSSSMKLHYRTFHLKEPYPKRNRKKKDEMLKLDEYPQEESDENMTLDRWR